MKKRQIIIIAVAVLILAGGKLISNLLAQPKEKPRKERRIKVTSVYTVPVKNDSIPISVESTGILEAVNRLALFSEVQGIMLPDNGKFKAGKAFKKGELLLAIRSNDQSAQLYAERSAFQSSLTAIMPDLRMDYPEEFERWNTYLKNYSTEKSVADLPANNSDKLKAFLVGRSIFSTYHRLKNLEIINQKYAIRAPYDGVLTEVNADPGTVIRQGQQLGIFIQPKEYELKISTDAATAEFLEVGQSVQLSLQGTEKKWKGRIDRLVAAIDVANQMSSFYVKVEGDDLKEGMFLQAKVAARKVSNAFEINRSALVDNSMVYLVQKDTLHKKAVDVVYFSQNTAVLQGLESGSEVLTKVPPSAFAGMKVKIVEEN